MAESRHRHPSARWPVPVDALRSRVAQMLDLKGVRHADVAAALLEVRGRMGLDVPGFARRFDVDEGLVVRAERGEVSVARLPSPLRQMVR